MRGTPRDAIRGPQDFREGAAACERLAEHTNDPKARATLLYEFARCPVPQLDARLALAKKLKIERESDYEWSCGGLHRRHSATL